MKSLIHLCCWTLLLFSCQQLPPESPTQPPPTLFASDPVVILKKGPEIQQYWEGDMDTGLFGEELGDLPALQAYQDSVKQAIGTETLKRIVERDTIQLTPWPEENENHLMTHHKKIGTIRPIQFLEAHLLNYQLSRYPLFSHPTEFGSPVLTHDSLNRIRVYFAASDQGWPPKAPELQAHMEQALSEGWKLLAHLHNHYESDSNLYLGIMAPSLSDAHFLKNWRDAYGLEEAWITNGFTTVVIPSYQLDTLMSH